MNVSSCPEAKRRRISAGRRKNKNRSDAKVTGGLLFFGGSGILYIKQNILYGAVENGAKIVEGHGADGLVVLEAVQKTAADPVIVDQLVSG